MIVFTDTKKDAQEISEHLQTALRTGARALHGDIPQATREKTLADFRAGKFQVLVATDVAARGLDINNITLVDRRRDRGGGSGGGGGAPGVPTTTSTPCRRACSCGW